jgi:hypothetical protein
LEKLCVCPTPDTRGAPLRKYLGTEHVSASQLVPPDVNDQVEQRDRDDDRRDEDQRLSVR